MLRVGFLVCAEWSGCVFSCRHGAGRGEQELGLTCHYAGDEHAHVGAQRAGPEQAHGTVGLPEGGLGLCDTDVTPSQIGQGTETNFKPQTKGYSLKG